MCCARAAALRKPHLLLLSLALERPEVVAESSPVLDFSIAPQYLAALDRVVVVGPLTSAAISSAYGSGMSLRSTSPSIVLFVFVIVTPI